MFSKKPKPLGELIRESLRRNGLETPLQQHRLLEAWDKVCGPTIASYTKEKTIRNQTLCVRIENPSLRQDLSMMRSKLIERLNAEAGAQIIVEIKFS